MVKKYYHPKQKNKDEYESEKQDILEIYNTHKGKYITAITKDFLKQKGMSLVKYPAHSQTILYFFV